MFSEFFSIWDAQFAASSVWPKWLVHVFLPEAPVTVYASTLVGLALFLDRARQLLSSPESVRRLNVTSGILLIGVGLVIPFL